MVILMRRDYRVPGPYLLWGHSTKRPALIMKGIRKGLAHTLLPPFPPLVLKEFSRQRQQIPGNVEEQEVVKEQGDCTF